MLNDFRYAIRTLRKNPGFTAVAVLTLALGIGANTAIFSLIDAVMLRMMPVKKPEELVQVIRIDPRWGSGSFFSHPAFERFRDHNQVFSEMFAVGGLSGLRVNLNGQTERAQVQLVSGTFYSTLGVHAILGRTLTVNDDKVPRGHPVAVLSYSYWKRRFALDSAVVGKTIRLNQISFTIIGVTPPEFFGVSVGRSPDICVPLMMEPVFQKSFLNDPLSNWLQIMARLKPGVSLQQAQADLATIFRQMPTSDWTSRDREEFLAQKLEVTPAGNGLSDLRRQFSEPLFILMMVVGLVLLISCANVANLLLARAAGRHREVAVRLAIGAGRGRLIRQLLTESVLLATLGGALGLLFAYWTNDFLLTFVSSRETPILLDLQPDPRILGFTALIALLASVLFGLAPALRATRVNLVSSLKQDFRTSSIAGSRFNLGKLLIVTQVALSLLLLIGAGLFVRTLQNLRTLDAGFNRENVLLFSMDPRESGYKGIRTANLYRQVLERLNALPGVRSASLSLGTPIEGGAWTAWVSVQGYAARPDEDMIVYLNRVGPRFFETLGMTLLLGRDFDSRDSENSPKVAVVNETMAHYFFGNENPIGRRFGWGDIEDRRDFEIVGVVKDAKYMDLREKTPRTAYVYGFQDADSLESTNFELRTEGRPNAILSQIRSEIQAIDKNLTISGVRTLDEQVNDSLRQERLVATLSSLFSLLALGLASIGLYGIMSYAVARRTNEIGIRMALGAEQRDVLWLVVRETVGLVLIGLAIGLPTALVATRLISSRLFGLTPTDPLTITLAALLLIVVSAFAGYLPARTASRVDPMVALRYE